MEPKTAAQILNAKKLFIFDMDGTIYLGNRVFPFAIRFIKNLRAHGKNCFSSPIMLPILLPSISKTYPDGL